MKTLTKIKIAYYMTVYIIVFAFMLQDTLGKIKSTLVLELQWKPLNTSTSGPADLDVISGWL